MTKGRAGWRLGSRLTGRVLAWLRLLRGMSQEDLARACQAHDAHCRLTAARVADYEAGRRRPSPAMFRIISQVLELSLDERRLLVPPPAHAGASSRWNNGHAEACDLGHRSGLSRPSTAQWTGAADAQLSAYAEALHEPAAWATAAVELACQADASTIGAGTLENLDQAVDRVCRDYPHAPPALLIPRVGLRLRCITRLLNGSLTLSQRRHLLIDGGWLAALMSCLQFDVGNRHAAEAAREAAFQLGREGGHEELIAWTFEILAWFALVDGRYPTTVALAQAGHDLAPTTSAGVQLAVQQAKAWAKLGDRKQAEQALRRGEQVLATLPTPAHPEHHFVFDAAKLSFYAATCYVWAGDTAHAEEHARHVIEQCSNGLGKGQWPTRLTIAQVDLGMVAAQRGELSAAAALGSSALASGRVVASTLGWIDELDADLMGRQPELPEIRDFHEQYLLARRATIYQ